MLAEDENGEEDGKGSFEVQHERADESGDARESGEQEEWPNDPAGCDDRNE